MSPADRDTLAVTADALTAFRLLAAGALVFMIPAEELTGVAVLLGIAWLTDLFDGRLARKSKSPTRLGRWDALADTAVGAGLVVGLQLGGVLAPWAAIGALLVFGALGIAGNVAALMILQLVGFVPTLWLLWTERPTLWWFPAVTALTIGVVDWRRLVFINIRGFLRGVAGKFEQG